MTGWLEQAKKLPLGHKSRIDCPECGANTGTKAAILNHNSKAYSYYCLACGANPFQKKGIMTLQEMRELEELNASARNQYTPTEALPKDFTTDIPLHGRLWLYGGGLSPTDWARHGIGYSPSNRRVILPIRDTTDQLVWQQQRAVIKGMSPKYLQPARDKGATIFIASPEAGRVTKRVIIVEDILSAIRVGRHITAVSILGTKLSAGQANRLSSFDECTTWLDGDSAGLNGSKAIRKAMSLLTRVSNIRTELDPKEYSDQQIREILKL